MASTWLLQLSSVDPMPTATFIQTYISLLELINGPKHVLRLSRALFSLGHEQNSGKRSSKITLERSEIVPGRFMQIIPELGILSPRSDCQGNGIYP